MSLVEVPDFLEPVNGEIWFRFDSPQSGLKDFKYIVKLFGASEPQLLNYSNLGKYKLPPRPVEGSALFSPDKMLRTMFDNNVNPFQKGWFSNFAGATAAGITKGLVGYKLEYGFELDPQTEWVDTYFTNGNLGLTFSATHSFQVGDIILLDKDNKQVNRQYDGTASVISVVNSYHIELNKLWGENTNNEGGVIRSLYRFPLGSSNDFYGFDGTRQYDEREKDFITYSVGTFNNYGEYLTDWDFSKYEKKIRLGEYETISMIATTFSRAGLAMGYITKDNSGATVSSGGSIISATNSFSRLDYGVGTQNLVDTFSINYMNVKNYEFRLLNLGSQEVARRLKYIIDDDCSPYDDYVRLCWKNRKGGWDYFSFIMDTKRTVSVERKKYKKILDYNYKIGDRGQTVYAVKSDDLYTINSNWISEYEAEFLENCITSPEVFMLVDKQKFPVIIENNSYEIQTYMRSGLIRVSLDVRMAFNKRIQND